MAPDSHGLTMLPLLSGERGPGWSDRAGAAIEGLTAATTPLDLLRAGLEAVALRFALLDADLPGEHTVVATGGGLANSPAWTQIVADALGRPVAHSGVAEGSSRGAAVMALEALGEQPGEAPVGETSSTGCLRRRRPTARRSSASRRSTSERSHRVRRLNPQETQRPGDDRLGRPHLAEPQRAQGVGARVAHRAVAVERRERLRELERVGGDAVRRAPLGRLGDLAGEGQQLLDQLTLGRVAAYSSSSRRRSRRSTATVRSATRAPTPCARCGSARCGRPRRSSPGRWVSWGSRRRTRCERPLVERLLALERGAVGLRRLRVGLEGLAHGRVCPAAHRAPPAPSRRRRGWSPRRPRRMRRRPAQRVGRTICVHAGEFASPPPVATTVCSPGRSASSSAKRSATASRPARGGWQRRGGGGEALDRGAGAVAPAPGRARRRAAATSSTRGCRAPSSRSRARPPPAPGAG